MTSVCTPTAECYRPFTVGHIAKSQNLNPKAHEFVPQNSSSYHTVITIGHLNINHLRYKMEEIREIIIHHKLHILGVTETWLDQTVSDGEVEIQGYRMFRLDRKGKAGGGVCIYIHQSLSVRPLPISKSELEMLWIGIKFKTKQMNAKLAASTDPQIPPSNSGTPWKTNLKVLADTKSYSWEILMSTCLTKEIKTSPIWRTFASLSQFEKPDIRTYKSHTHLSQSTWSSTDQHWPTLHHGW